MGYEVAHFGLSQWNGVAIASRVGLDDVERTFLDQPVFGKNGKDAVQEARAIGATCGGIRVWSLYVPNGRALDDEHMPYKLSWLDTLKTHAERLGHGRPRGADRPDGRLEHRARRTTTSGTSTSSAPTASPTSANRSGPPSTPSRRPASRTWSARTPRAPASTPTGTTRSCASRRRKACGSTSSWPPPPWPPGSPAPPIDREERKGKGASDHAPVIVELARLMSCSPGKRRDPMTGNLYRGQAGLPFSSALRVYEPLEAFPEDAAGSPARRRAPGALPARPSKTPSCWPPWAASPGPAGTRSPPARPTWCASCRHPAKRRASGAGADGADGRRRDCRRRGSRTACCTAPASWCSGPGWPPTP